jgi:membrane-bound metal-dependent hydrolase YbcI (DUF457 family)
MPFTPFHMGPGIAVKAVLQRRFSVMVFGWSQIVIDIQPLVVMINGQGQVHGFTHTYIGATLIALFCAITGKYLGEIGLRIIRLRRHLPISWSVSFISAFIGTYSHVFFDSIMHSDITPFAPFSSANGLHGIISVGGLYLFCVISGIH